MSDVGFFWAGRVGAFVGFQQGFLIVSPELTLWLRWSISVAARASGHL